MSMRMQPPPSSHCRVIGSTGFTGPSYALASYDRNVLSDDSRPALTAAAAHHIPELTAVFGENFIIVLRFLIKHQWAARPSPDAAQPPVVTSDDFKAEFTGASPEFLSLLPGIFQREPVMRRGYQTWGTSPGGWQFQLHRGLMSYRDVETLPAYVDKVTELIEEQQQADAARYGGVHVIQANTIDFSPTLAQPIGVPPTITPVIEPPRYVNADLITELEQKQGQTKWNLDKLLQLLRELDSNYAVDNAYSCHTLLRAIIDHVPPILGHPSFEVAAPSHTWSRTDKKYMKRLLDFKVQADDVLHRPIRQSANVITMHDLPQAAALNALLRECIDKL
jgi:hypothetical protein